MNVSVMGSCEICGGPVVVPQFHYSVVPPRPQCQNCGAVAKANGPEIPMERPGPDRPPWQHLTDPQGETD